MRHQFLILGYYGWQNTGDDAMIFTLLHELHRRSPLATFTIPARAPFTIPEEARQFVKLVEVKPWVILRELMKSSAFVMGGGTHIYDKGDSLGRLPFGRLPVLSGWLAALLCAKILRNRIYLVGIGIEPPQTKWGVFLTKHILRLADFISVRDAASYRIVKNMGFEHKSVLSFDLSALLLDLDSSPPQRDWHQRQLSTDVNTTKIGISVLPFFKTYEDDAHLDELFVRRIAEALNQWLEKDDKNIIYLFTVKGSLKKGDVRVTDRLRAQLFPPERVRSVPYSPDPRKAFCEVAQCDAFVGMRYHSCIFAYLSSVPLLIINYFHKCEALAEDVRLPQSALITPDEIMNGLLGERLTLLDTCPGSFIAELSPLEAKKMAEKNLPGGGGILADFGDN